MTTPALTLDGLTVRIPTAAGTVHAATDVDLTLTAGQVHALVGESGCGKSGPAPTTCSSPAHPKTSTPPSPRPGYLGKHQSN